ncbi:UNVERIFIED_CONTAM: chemotaxis protein MotB [Acetivibrio alkalicellulosi]
MRKKNHDVEEEQSEGAPEWMVTYSDLVTLLLTFFILLFSMAVIDKDRFEQVASSLRSAFLSNSDGEMFDHNKGKEIISITDSIQSSDLIESNIGNITDINNEGRVTGGKEDDEAEKTKGLEEFVREIKQYILDMELDEYVTVLDEKTQVILRIDSVILFDLGRADIKREGETTLKKIGELLNDFDAEVAVQGHTDNLPINTHLFPSNWELSTRRATNVVLFFVEESRVNPIRLTATGNGEFRPIAPNDNAKNRQKNRRIDIVIDK